MSEMNRRNFLKSLPSLGLGACVAVVAVKAALVIDEESMVIAEGPKEVADGLPVATNDPDAYSHSLVFDEDVDHHSHDVPLGDGLHSHTHEVGPLWDDSGNHSHNCV